MTSLTTLLMLAAAPVVLAVPTAAPAQSGTAQAPASTCLPEHAAMGHCTLPATQPAPPPPPTPSACSPEHAAMGHCTLPTPKLAPPASAPTCSPEHAAMGHCSPPTPKPAPPATAPTCSPEHAAMGHCTPATPKPAPPAQAANCSPEHAAMGHCTLAASGTAEGTDLPAGNAPPPPVPTDHAGDAVYGAAAMGMGRHHLKQFHGDQKFSQVMLNVFEAQWRNGRDGYEWDGEAWYGGDIHRLWLKSEGEGAFGEALEKAELQALYSRAVGPYFNLQGGFRYDVRPNPSRGYATIGVEGLAPGFFEVEGALFLSNKGELMARLEGSYDQRITQRLILQPSAELNFAAQSSREIGVGKGLSDAEVGLRLRYDIRREFSPYVGVQYRRAFGDTRRFLKEEGEDAGSWSLLTGIRMWF